MSVHDKNDADADYIAKEPRTAAQIAMAHSDAETRIRLAMMEAARNEERAAIVAWIERRAETIQTPLCYNIDASALLELARLIERGEHR